MRKKLLSLFLILAMCAAMLPTVTLTARALETDSDGNYIIASADDLVAFSTLVNSSTSGAKAKARQTADIDMSGVTWTPIGNSSSAGYFYGTYDGQGYTIKNLTYNGSETDYTGGFVRILTNSQTRGTIKNVTFENLQVTGSAAYRVGGIAGYVRYGAKIEGCQVISGTITGSSTANADAGGIAGGIYTSTVTNCYNAATISGAGGGGIAGQVWESTVSHCYNAGSVSSTGNISSTGYICGGIAGEVLGQSSGSTIDTCYNTADITGGGIVGSLSGVSSSKHSTMKNCYDNSSSSYLVFRLFSYVTMSDNECKSSSITTSINTYNTSSLVTKSNNQTSQTWTDEQLKKICKSLSHFCWINNKCKLCGSDCSISHTYGDWTDAGDGTHTRTCSVCGYVDSAAHTPNADDSDCTTAVNCSTCGGVTTAAKLCHTPATTYSSDATYHWFACTIDGCTQITGKAEHTLVDGVCSACGYGYQSGGLTAAADGYYEIYTYDQLVAFAGKVNGGETSANARLMRDITANADVLTGSIAGGYSLNGTPANMWTPIGTDSKQYTGTFDGQNHTISGLYYSEESNQNSYAGLFGYCASAAKIKNVNVEDSYFCKTKGSNRIGGICGLSYGTITQCSYSGYVGVSQGGAHYVGGICGYNNSGTITTCFFNGTLSGSQVGDIGGCGGIVGFLYNNNVTNCYSACTINSDGNVGAIVGYFSRLSAGNIYGSYFDNSIFSGNGCGATDWNATYYATINITEKATDDFKSGAVCCLLNGDTGTTWKQTLGTDDYPSFKGLTVQESGGNYVNRTHKWTYSASDATLTATCSECNTTASLTLTAPTNPIYDGTAKAATLSASAKSAWTDCGLTVPKITYSENGNVNAGQVTASITKDDTTTATVTYTIAKATLTVRWSESPQTSSYTASGPTVTAPVVTLPNGGGFSGANISYSYSTMEDGTYTSGLPTEVGTYYVKASVAESNNYNAAETSSAMKLIINTIAPTITWTEAEQTVTYTGSAASFSQATVSNGAAITYTYSANGGETYTDDKPVNAGTYYVKASVAAQGDYTAAESVMILIVGKATPTIAWAAASQTVRLPDSGDITITAPTVTLVNNETYDGEIAYSYKADSTATEYTTGLPTTAGTYYVKASIAESENYIAAETSTDLVLTVKDNTGYTVDNPFEITSEETLNEFAELVEGDQTTCGKVTKSFTVSSTTSWTPMGTADAPYTGTFDGGGYTITGLTASGANSGDAIGLFGYVEGATIKDLTLADVSIKASGKDGLAGAICGKNIGGTITGCTISGTVSAYGQYGRAGSICGYSQSGSTISDCTNKAEIITSGESGYCGGICGLNTGTVTGCTNTGWVRASGQKSKAGGACGSNAGTVSGCTTGTTVRVSVETCEYSATLNGNS